MSRNHAEAWYAGDRFRLRIPITTGSHNDYPAGEQGTVTLAWWGLTDGLYATFDAFPQRPPEAISARWIAPI